VRLKRRVRCVCALAVLGSVLFAQGPELSSSKPPESNPFGVQARNLTFDPVSTDNAAAEKSPAIPPEPQSPEIKRTRFDWYGASQESFYFLSMQHGLRMVQRKTRTQLDGRFFHDYADAVSGLGGWGDTDTVLTNYVGHPMMGAITGYIQIQNDPNGIGLEFGSRNPAYWRSRLKAMGWAAFYSTQFELGPVSEASIGNVGSRRGTMGYVDLVMTPVGGFGWILAEDAADKHFIRKWEEGRSDGMKRLLRIVFNPNRSFANALRLKKPWHRDTRSMSWDAR
jgi:hypothetical protein